MRRNVPIILVTLLLVALAIFQNSQWKPQVLAAHISSPEIARGKPFPEFELEGLDGKVYQVNGEREKPLIINFWASWCGPCHEEAPDLKRMYEKYGEKIDIIAVNATKGDQLEDVKDFVTQYQFTFPVLLDRKGKVSDQFRILFVPTSFLINKKGVIKEVIHVLPAEQLEKRIQKLISE
jgi:thiol-disulfide isomerase/thioredoxin